MENIMTHLIVLDDDPSVGLFVHDALQEDGWTVTVCEDRDTFDCAVSEASPDVVLLDLHLTRQGDGWNVLNELKARRDTARVPVIMCSGDRYTLQDHSTMLDGLAAAVLVKP